MGEDIIYHDDVKHLEESISYGTLGILHGVAENRGPTLYFINLATIVRNNIVKDRSDEQVLKSTLLELPILDENIKNLSPPGTKVVLYLDEDIYPKIPEASRRPPEKSAARATLQRLTKALAVRMHGVKGRLIEEEPGVFTYRVREQMCRELWTVKGMIDRAADAILVSHCSVDFLGMVRDPKLSLIQSNRGNLLTLKDLGKKVFKLGDKIPFNWATLALLGDSDFVKPLIKNRKKFVTAIGDRIRVMSPNELSRKAVKEFGVDRDAFKWIK